MGGHTHLGASCRKARQARELSLRAAAAATGVSDRYILEIEQGRRNPSLGILERLAAGYGTTVGRLLRDAKIR